MEGNQDLNYAKILGRFNNIYKKGVKIAIVDVEEKTVESSSFSKLRKNWGLEDVTFVHTAEELTDLLCRLYTWESTNSANGTITNITNIYNLLTSEGDLDFKTTLINIEPFLRTVHALTYEGVTNEYNGCTYRCSDGVKVAGCGKEKINFYVKELVGRWKVNADSFEPLRFDLHAVDGKVGITDRLNDTINNIGELIACVYRNTQSHGNNLSGSNIEDSQQEYKYQKEDEGYAIQSFILMVMHVLDYRYDVLDRTYNNWIEQYKGKGSTNLPEPTTVDTEFATKYIKEHYIPYVIREANDTLKSFESRIIDLTVSDASELLDQENANDKPNKTAEIEVGNAATAADNGRMLLCGGSGVGKSTSMTRLMRLYAKLWDSENAERLLPVRFNLLNYNQLVNIVEACLPIVPDRALTPEEKGSVIRYFNQLLEEGRVVFMFDGLNEVQPEHRDDLINRLKPIFNVTYPALRFIMTTRIEEVRDLFQKLRVLSADEDQPVVCYKINPLNQRQIKEYTRQKSQTHSKKIIAAIEGSDVLTKLSNNPMQLDFLTTILSDSRRLDDKKLNRAVLYKEYINKYLARERRDINRNEIANYVERFTYQLGLVSTAVIDHGGNAVKGAIIPNFDLEVIPVAQSLKILQSTKDNRINFTHDSYTHYFGAQYIRMQMDSMEFDLDSAIEKYIVRSNRPELLQMFIELELSEDHYDTITRLITSYLYVSEKSGKKSDINPGLKILGSILSQLPQQQEDVWHPQKDGIGTREITAVTLYNAIVMNTLNHYRCKYNDTYDYETLKEIINLIGITSSEKLVDQLFRPYWLRYWALNADDAQQQGLPMPQEYIERADYSSFTLYTIIKNLKEPEHFFKKAFELSSTLKKLGMHKSMSEMLNRVADAFYTIDDKALEKIYGFITENKETIANARQHAQRALMSMSNPEWIDKIDETEVSESEGLFINPHIISKQADNVKATGGRGEKIYKLIDEHLKKLDERYIDLSILWLYNLARRKAYSDSVLVYAAELIERGQKVEKLRSLIDLYPIDMISDQNIERFGLDQDVVRLTKESSNLVGSRIPYVLCNATDQTLVIIIPDIDEKFNDKKFRLPKYSADHKHVEYIEYPVKEDSISKSALVKFIIKPLQDGVRLPLQGCFTYKDKNKNEVTEQYAAKHSGVNGLELELLNNYCNSLKLLYNKMSILTIDGIECTVDSFEEIQKPQYYRLVKLANTGDMPQRSGQAMVVDAGNNIQQRFALRLLTPKEKQAKYFRRTTATDKDAPNYYSIYGCNEKQVMIWSEISNLPNSCQLTFNGEANKTAIVSETRKFPAKFVEIHLRISSPDVPPRYGKMLMTNKSSRQRTGNTIPYIFSYQSGNHYVLRVDDPVWVDRIDKDREAVEAMVYDDKYTINGHQVQISLIEVIEHAKNTKCVSLNGSLATLGIADQGTFTLPEGTNLKPSYAYGARSKFDCIDLSKVVGNTEDGQKEIELSSAKEGVKYHGLHKILYLLCKGSLCRAEKVETSDGSVRYKVNPKDYGSGLVLGPLDLYYYCPVCNSGDVDLFDIDRGYYVDNVHYTKEIDGRSIKFPKPDRNVNGLYYKIDGSEQICQVKKTYGENSANGYFQTICIQKPDGAEIKDQGVIRFYEDAECLYPVSLKYTHIISQIELNRPEKYHADTCELLFNECRESGKFTVFVWNMLKAHGKASLLLDEFINDTPEARKSDKYPAGLRFNICTVLRQTDYNVKLMSVNGQNEEDSADTRISNKSSDVVMLESTGEIVVRDLSEHIPEFGYRRGVVIWADKENNDYRIQAGFKAEDRYYYHSMDGNELNWGDEVTFMPSVNLRKHQEKTAVRVKYCKSGLRKGTIEKIETNAEEGSYLIKILDSKDPSIKGSRKIYKNETFMLEYLQDKQPGSQIDYFFPSIEVNNKLEYPKIDIVIR